MFKTKKATGQLGLLLNKPEKTLDNLEKLYGKIRELVYQNSPYMYAFHRVANYTATERQTGFRCVIIVHMQARHCREPILRYLEKQNTDNKNKAHPDRLFK